MTIILDPADGGYVSGPGISCGNGYTDCQESFALGTSVTLTAQENDGYIFQYWIDDYVCYIDSTLTITMGADKTLTVLFGKRPVIIPPITGYSQIPFVKRARWQGQPPAAPDPGDYFNDYVIEGYYNDDPLYGKAAANPCKWIVNGTGFGDSSGEIEFSNNDIGVANVIWGDTQIKFVPIVPYDFESDKNVQMTITNSDGVASDPITIPVIGILKSRGYGQCTWYVAKTLMDQHRPIPDGPIGAYTTTHAITADYEPWQWDALTFGRKHVAVIIGEVSRRDEPLQTGGTLTTYEFKVGEMNADPPWGEKESVFDGVFAVRVDPLGRKRIVTNKMSAMKGGWATGYFRTEEQPTKVHTDKNSAFQSRQ